MRRQMRWRRMEAMAVAKGSKHQTMEEINSCMCGICRTHSVERCKDSDREHKCMRCGTKEQEGTNSW